MRYQTCKLHLRYTSSKVTASPHLPGNLARTLFNTTVKPSLRRKNVCTEGQDFHYVLQSFTLYVELSSVQLLFSFFFYSDNAKIISVKQIEKSIGKPLTI